MCALLWLAPMNILEVWESGHGGSVGLLGGTSHGHFNETM